MSADSGELVMPELDWGYDAIEDMAERLARIERDGRHVVPVRYQGGVAWLIVGHELITRIWRDELRFPAARFFRRTMDTLGTSLFYLDGDIHRSYKSKIISYFSPTVVRRLTDTILVPLADQIIDDFGGSTEIEFLSDYGRRYAFGVMSRVLGLDVPRADEGRVMAMVHDLLQIKDPVLPFAEKRTRALEAIDQTNSLLLPLLDARRSVRRDDLMSHLIDLEVDGRRLKDDEVLDFARSFYMAGADSTALQLGNVLNAILGDPEMRDLLLREPEARMAAIDEFSRLETSVGLVGRFASEDVEIDGTIIPADSLILLGVPGANRSSTRFPDPDQALLDRTRQGSLTFGAGARTCPGSHLARQEMKISLDRMLQRLPGLRLAGKPARPGGTLFRFLAEGLPLRFDRVLPREAPAMSRLK